MKNLQNLLQEICSFYSDSLDQVLVMSLPDVIKISHMKSLPRDPMSEDHQDMSEDENEIESWQELHKLLLLMLGSAVQCDRKEEFIEEIKKMSVNDQHEIVSCIQEMVDNPTTIWINSDWGRMSNFNSMEDQERMYSLLVHHVNSLSKERNQLMIRLIDLYIQLDRLHEIENHCLKDSQRKKSNDHHHDLHLHNNNHLSDDRQVIPGCNQRSLGNNNTLTSSSSSFSTSSSSRVKNNREDEEEEESCDHHEKMRIQQEEEEVFSNSSSSSPSSSDHITSHTSSSAGSFPGWQELVLQHESHPCPDGVSDLHTADDDDENHCHGKKISPSSPSTYADDIQQRLMITSLETRQISSPTSTSSQSSSGASSLSSLLSSCSSMAANAGVTNGMTIMRSTPVMKARVKESSPSSAVDLVPNNRYNNSSPEDSSNHSSSHQVSAIMSEMTEVKSKLRRLHQEIEDKNEIIAELKEFLDQSKESCAKLRQENLELVQEARSAKALRDEIDILNERVRKLDRLESEVERYKERLKDMDFFRSRVEELREDNRLLTESKSLVEKQLEATRKKCEKLTDFESQVLQMKALCNELQEARDSDADKSKQLISEISTLRIEKKSALDELLQVQTELTHLRSQFKSSQRPDQIKRQSASVTGNRIMTNGSSGSPKDEDLDLLKIKCRSPDQEISSKRSSLAIVPFNELSDSNLNLTNNQLILDERFQKPRCRESLLHPSLLDQLDHDAKKRVLQLELENQKLQSALERLKSVQSLPSPPSISSSNTPTVTGSVVQVAPVIVNDTSDHYHHHVHHHVIIPHVHPHEPHAAPIEYHEEEVEVEEDLQIEEEDCGHEDMMSASSDGHHLHPHRHHHNHDVLHHHYNHHHHNPHHNHVHNHNPHHHHNHHHVGEDLEEDEEEEDDDVHHHHHGRYVHHNHHNGHNGPDAATPPEDYTVWYEYGCV